MFIVVKEHIKQFKKKKIKKLQKDGLSTENAKDEERTNEIEEEERGDEDDDDEDEVITIL